MSFKYGDLVTIEKKGYPSSGHKGVVQKANYKDQNGDDVVNVEWQTGPRAGENVACIVGLLVMVQAAALRCKEGDVVTIAQNGFPSSGATGIVSKGPYSTLDGGVKVDVTWQDGPRAGSRVACDASLMGMVQRVPLQCDVGDIVTVVPGGYASSGETGVVNRGTYSNHDGGMLVDVTWQTGSRAGVFVTCMADLLGMVQAAGDAVGAQMRTFKHSNFRLYYNTRDAIEFQHELFSTLLAFLRAFADLTDEPESKAKALFTRLQKEAMEASPLTDILSEIQRIAVRLWTSAAKDGFGREFCSLLNEVIRRDVDGPALEAAVKICKAMNSMLVCRRKAPSQQPMSWPSFTWRGTSMPAKSLEFFQRDKMYRAPMMLATAFNRSTAFGFLQMQPADRIPVLFKFNLDEELRCVHALHIEDLTLCKGESEFLYVAYSAFQVRSVTVPPTPKINWQNPVLIELYVQPDNSLVDEQVPLAEWH